MVTVEVSEPPFSEVHGTAIVRALGGDGRGDALISGRSGTSSTGKSWYMDIVTYYIAIASKQYLVNLM